MKRTTLTALTTLAVAALPSAVRLVQAQEAKLPAEMSQLDVFEGTSNCTGQLLATPFTPTPHATIGKSHANKSLDGRWVHFSYTEQKTPVSATPYSIEGFLGYSERTKQFVQVVVDNTGAKAIAYSSGWDGDSMTFQGSEDNSGVRDVYTKKGPHVFMHTGYGQGKDKQWIKVDEETCVRSS